MLLLFFPIASCNKKYQPSQEYTHFRIDLKLIWLRCYTASLTFVAVGCLCCQRGLQAILCHIQPTNESARLTIWCTVPAALRAAVFLPYMQEQTSVLFLQLDQRLVVVVDFYETTKSDIAAFVAQLKDTHGERLESFVAAREGVSCWFKGLAKVLKEEGVRSGSVYVVGTLQEFVELAVSTMKDGAVKGG